MSSLYDNINSNDLNSNKEYSRLYAPQLTRTRQIYKGPRDSEKVNLEINQILFDINWINEKIEALKLAQEDIVNVFEHGGNGGSDYPDLADAEVYSVQLSSSSDFMLLSLEELQYGVAEIVEFIQDFMNGIYTDG